MEKQLFTFPIVKDTDPIDQDPFYAFLAGTTYHNIFQPVVLMYLVSLGFNPEQHKISDGDMKQLKHIFQHFHDMKTLLQPQRIEDLFGLDDPNGVLVHYRGINMSTRYQQKRALLDAIHDHTVHGIQYHFEIRDTTLTLVYDQILGSVRVCELIPE